MAFSATSIATKFTGDRLPGEDLMYTAGRGYSNTHSHTLSLILLLTSFHTHTHTLERNSTLTHLLEYTRTYTHSSSRAHTQSTSKAHTPTRSNALTHTHSLKCTHTLTLTFSRASTHSNTLHTYGKKPHIQQVRRTIHLFDTFNPYSDGSKFHFSLKK